MVHSDKLLAAGALLPLKTSLSSKSGVDDLSARSYRHAALGDSPVVKLSADNLAAGDDLTMEFLGFDSPEVQSGVAKRRRQALGFPEWALVHDAKHARYALDLVKEFKKEARRARSKPGHAYEGFTNIASRLGKSVAHFLPSFWEQAGREFIAVGNTTYASRAFGKAREAENVHGLEIDEQIRQDAFLEFALAGCVSAKALIEYAHVLQKQHDPAKAWTVFRELCLRRTLGGMPPWTSLVKDLTGLLKTTELDPVAELEQVLAEIIASPAINRAPMGFWKGAAAAIKKLVTRNDQVAGILLNMIPASSAWERNDLWPWLEYLDAWGILSNIWEDGIPEQAQPTEGAAAWFTRACQSVDTLHPPIFDLLETLAPRLKRDGVPLDLCHPPRWGGGFEIDPNLLDLTLSLGIVVADPPADAEVEICLYSWCRDADSQFQPRDLVHVSADKRFSAMLRKAVHAIAGNAEFEASAHGKAGLTEARREWLQQLFQVASDAALPAVEQLIETLQGSTSRQTFAEFPEAYAVLKAFDVVPGLTRTIQAGLPDEYGWPALEKLVEDYTAKDKKTGKQKPPFVTGHFPYVIVSDGLRASVIRGDEIILEAELQIPKRDKLKGLMYLDGNLLVWAGSADEATARWQGHSKKTERSWCWRDFDFGNPTFDLPDGGTFIGNGTVFTGQDSVLHLSVDANIYHDGEHFWRREWSRETQASMFHLVDPVTGKTGRQSLPAWFEDYIEDEWELVDGVLSIAAFGDVIRQSPLGCQDGLVGMRGRRRGTVAEFERIDGRTHRTENDSLVCNALLEQPGTAEFLLIDDSLFLWDPDGQYQVAHWGASNGVYHQGQVAAVPWEFLHLHTVRDESASTVLRNVTHQQVADLLKAEQVDADAWTGTGLPDQNRHYRTLDQAIRKLLPNTKAERLTKGLRGVVVHAGQQARRLQRLVETRDPEEVDQSSQALKGDAYAQEALQQLRCWFELDSDCSLMAGFSAAAAYFLGEQDDPRIPWNYLQPLVSMLDNVPGKLWPIVVQEPGDKQWLEFYEGWSDLPFFDMEGEFRSYSIEVKGSNPLMDLSADDEDFDEDEDGPDCLETFQQHGNRYLIHRTYGRSFEVLEFSPEGEFAAIEGTVTDADEPCLSLRSIWSSQQLRSFVDMARKPLVFPDADYMQQVAEDIGITLAELVYIWFGFPGEHSYEHNFMPKEIRSAYKLKVKDCANAKLMIATLPETTREALVSAPLHFESGELPEDSQQVAARIKAAWAAHCSNRVDIPDVLSKELSQILSYQVDQAEFFSALADPSASPLFQTDVKWSIGRDDYDWINICNDASDDHAFDDAVLASTACIAALLFYRLPSGDPLHDCAAKLISAATAALDNPELILSAGRSNLDLTAAEGVAAVEAAVGKVKTVKDKSNDTLLVADNGAVIAAQIPGEFSIANGVVGFRPAKVKTTKQIVKLNTQLQALITDRSDGSHSDTMLALRLVRSKDFKAIASRVKKTPVPAGEYEANPVHSVPKLIDDVVNALDISDDAAAYYLQLLTLPDPTDRNVKQWNGWTPARIKKAGQALVDGKLVLEAKRSRAGRKFFLPGGWEALPAPHLPLETWKMPLFQMTRDSHGHAVAPLARILPLEPVHTLFAKTWNRIEDGDVPEYEEVV